MREQSFGTQLSNRDFFIRRWSVEYPAFVDVFKALPPDRLDYRPHAGSRSAGELVALLVSLERSCVELCETGQGSYNSRLRVHAAVGPATLDAMIAVYQERHHALAERVNDLVDATWDEPPRMIRVEHESRRRAS